MISPYAVRLLVKVTEESGRVAGTLYFVSTFGSALGTLGTSFYFVLWFELNTIVAMLGRRARSARVPGFRRRADGMKHALLLALGLACAFSPAEEIIHEERSLYGRILVTREAGQLCMKFAVQSERRRQSCIDERAPQKMALHYTRMMMASLLLAPEPDSILITGLGGGTLPKALAELLPDARIDVVEIDAAVVSIADRFFDFRAAGNTRVFVRDARVFTRRALRDGKRYELILLDTFDGDYIPEHLMTLEYLQETRRLLAPNGVLAANTFATSRLYDHESETYYRAFGPFFNFTIRESANRIVLASIMPLPDNQSLRRAARPWRQRLAPYGVSITSYPRRFDRAQDWNRDRRPLTDQYSPANVLQRMD